MLEIALKGDQNGIYQKEISVNQKISFKYLDQIISALKVAGLITNVKGKKSGYVLTKDAKKITMYDIVKAFEPDINIVDCLSEKIQCKDENHCAPRDFWEGLNNQIIEYFSKYTLKDLKERQKTYNNSTTEDFQTKDER